jgi:hypothetical protein
VLARKGILSSVVHASTTAVATQGGAEIRRMKDNRLFRSVVETPKVPATEFIKHLSSICEQVKDTLGEECYVYWKGTKFISDKGELKSAGQAVKKFQEKRAFAASPANPVLSTKMPAGLKADIDSVLDVLKFLKHMLETEASKGKQTYIARFLLPRLGTADRELRNITPSQYKSYPKAGDCIADALERIDVLQTLVRDKYNAECDTQEIKIKTAKAMIQAIITCLEA